MAFHVSTASHTHLYHDTQSTPSPFSRRPQIFSTLKLTPSQSQPPKSSLIQAPQTPPKSRTNNIWVNPKAPKASKLRQHSYDARYGSLIKISNLLNSCSTYEDVSEILDNLDEPLLEQDAVIVLNNMENPETAVFALRYVQKKLELSRERVLYNVSFKVCRKGRDFTKAEVLFEEMLERGITPDNITFTTIISCARMCGLPSKAVEMFERMGAFECMPDDVTYSAMIDAYGRAGNVEKALSLYDKARTEKWRIDAVTFGTVIKLYGVEGNFDGALNVYEEMKALGVKPNLVIYNTLLDAMGRAKRPWQAKSIYRDMVNNGLEPSSSTYSALLRAYCRSRYGEDALTVYREMKGKGVELNVVLYNSLLSMCADIGYVDESVEIYDDMKRSETCTPDSWTFSSLITMYSCSGKVTEAENVLNEMLEAGFEPNIFVLTSLIQCYGKAKRADDVVKTFDRLLELGITADDRFCSCLLNVMTQLPKEDVGKLAGCIEKANTKLGYVVTLLMEEETPEEIFKEKANELFNIISKDVRKAYCNCLIDLCVNLNLLKRACELLNLGLALQIYTDLQSKSPTQWSLQLKSLSHGAAITAFHVWTTDLSKALDNGDELPALLGINTGHGKHKYSDKGLASVLESHLRELNAPFHEAENKAGWLLTTKVAAKSWLESMKSPEPVAA